MREDINVFDPRDREFTSLKLIAKIPTIAAISYRTAMVKKIQIKGKYFI